MAHNIVRLSETSNRLNGHLADVRPEIGFVLAAGLGKRMRPLTAITPKPLIEVAGKPIIDYSLDHLRKAGIREAVINTHYLADQIVAHAKAYPGLEIRISDERDALLETGGGVRKALPLLGPNPFYVINGDSFWVEGARPNLAWLAESWNDETMDMLLLLAPTVDAVGYSGSGDFLMDSNGRLTRRPEKRVAPYAYAGAILMHPRAMKDTPEGSFSLNLVFDRLIEKGRLHGVRMDGLWLHVGTPDAIGAAENAIGESAA